MIVSTRVVTVVSAGFSEPALHYEVEALQSGAK
jgi:hypothetical protein